MMRWFQALMPKEERFFDLFNRHSETLIAGAEALRALLEGGAEVPNYCKVIVDREQDADAITREVLLAVRRTFITPFDRGDIKNLITAMDDAIDQMQKTAKVITLFEVRSFDPPMQEMGNAIVQSARLVHEAVPLLAEISRHATRLSSLAEQISILEGHADDVHDSGRKALYESCGASNAIGFVTGSEIYDHLEKVVDRFDDVANEIQSIVIEHV